MQTVINQPAVEGVTVHNIWSSVETTAPGPNICGPVGTDICQMDSSGWTHSYDWSSVDSDNLQWFQAQGGSKKVNVVLQGIQSVGAPCLIDNTCINTSTPYYVTSPTWAAHIGAGTLDLINGNKDGCSLWVGIMPSSMTRDATGLVTVVSTGHGYQNGDLVWVGRSTPSDYNVEQADVSSVQVASNTLTITAPNSYPVGMQVEFLQLGNATFLNGQTVTVISSSATQFTASFTHADYGPTAETAGVAEPLGVPVKNVTANSFQYQSGTHTADAASTPGTIISSQQSWPVPYESPYKTAWEAFVAAGIAHFNQSPHLSQIAYMRVGRATGGEAYPYCTNILEALPTPNTYSMSGWLQYFTDIDDFVQAQSPAMQILDPINAAETPPLNSYGASEAAIAVAHHNAKNVVNGFGSQGMRSSDITNYPQNPDLCSSDWCAMFDQYYSAGYPLELQQIDLSDPTASLNPMSQTGDLRPLLPFAVQRHMTILELYAYDALLAYDPNYCVLTVPDTQVCTTGSVQIPATTLPPADQYPYFQLVGQPGQTGATGDGSYAKAVNQTEGSQ